MATEQPLYENIVQTNTIIYERQDTQITNLDEDGDDIILQEDHIYYAHVSYFIKIVFIQ